MFDRISVAMATFNGIDYIQEQMASLAEQVTRPFEVVISDDASTDGTFEYLESLVDSSVLNIRLYRNVTRVGWRANFMSAAARCEGEWIAFCDQDDIWDPTKLDRLAASADQEDVQLVFHDATFIDSAGRPLGPLLQCAGQHDDHVFDILAMDFWVPVLGFSMMIRRSVVDQFPGWDRSVDKLDASQRAAHDQWALFIAGATGRIVHLHLPLVQYRMHLNNAMGFRVRRRPVRDLLLAHAGSRSKVLQRLGVTENRIDILARLVYSIDEGNRSAGADAEQEILREKAQRALGRYQDHLYFNSRRLALHSSRNPARRASVLLNGLRQSRYSTSPLPLSRAELVRDVVGVLLGPSMRKAS